MRREHVAVRGHARAADDEAHVRQVLAAAQRAHAGQQRRLACKASTHPRFEAECPWRRSTESPTFLIFPMRRTISHKLKRSRPSLLPN